MNNINGKTSVYGLIGNPVEHTLSPFIHNTLAKKLGINMVYVPFHVENHLVDDCIKGIKALNIKGINITVPHKVSVFNIIDKIDKKAKIIGAVNVLKIDGKKEIIGLNTDADGLYVSCKKNNINIENKTVCIVGAGGAAKAVAVMCCDKKVKKIYIANRTIEKAIEIKNTLNEYFSEVEVEIIEIRELEVLKDVNICFQTTSVGMYPNIKDNPVKSIEFIKSLDCAVDLIYNPYETEFIKIAKEHNIQTLNGLGMLFYQGVEAFKIWNNIDIEDKILDECFKLLEDKVYN